MTVSSSVYRNKIFITCINASVPNGKYFNPNDTDGSATHFVYGISGSISVYSEQDEFQYRLNKGDIRDVYSDIGISSNIVAGPDGAHYIAFNFLPKERKFDAEMISGAQSKTLIGSDKIQVVFNIEGELYCNEKKIDMWKCAFIPLSKEVTVNVPEGSLAVLFTEK